MDDPSDLEPKSSEPSRRAPLPIWLKIVLLFLGWLVLLVGIAGLVLPGIQGVVTIVLGAAILSVASERVYFGFRLLLRRWPKIRQRFDRFRHRMHDRLTRHR